MNTSQWVAGALLLPALLISACGGDTDWEAALFGGTLNEYEDRQEEPSGDDDDDSSPAVSPEPSPEPSPSPSPSPTPPAETPSPTQVPDGDGDGSPDVDDCDDNNPGTYPGAPEYCDGKDNDCDREVDEDALDPRVYQIDADGDEYAVFVTACLPPDGGNIVVSSKGEDCDDTNASINSGAGNCPEE